MANEMKPDQTPKKDAIRDAIDNNPCGMCRAFGVPVCPGHGGSGGGGSGSGGGEERKGSESGNPIEAHGGAISERPLEFSKISFSSSNDIKIDWDHASKSILDLDLGMLSVKSDGIRGILSIEFKPGLSDADKRAAKEVLQMIKNEFGSFKEALKDRGVSVSIFTCEIKDDKLTINIPVPQHYREFIQHLSSKNLLPMSYTSDADKKDMQSNTSRISPFDISKGPIPKGFKE